MGQLRWTEKVSGHLQAIHEYIAQDSKVYPARFIKSLIKATSKLEFCPAAVASYRNSKIIVFVKLYM